MEEMIQVKTKSVIPYYAVGMVWILYGIAFPLYRIMDFIFAACLSAGVWWMLRRVIPPKVSYVKKPFVDTGDATLNQILKDGEAFATLLSHSQGMDAHLDVQYKRMYASMESMVSYLRTHTMQLSNIRRFMNYYVPTITKLIQTHQQMEDSNLGSATIAQTKESIEKVMEQAATAFENQVDALYQSIAIDIASDITVLELMLQKEGLMKSEFEEILARNQS